MKQKYTFILYEFYDLLTSLALSYWKYKLIIFNSKDACTENKKNYDKINKHQKSFIIRFCLHTVCLKE